jgi:hypothetical protein
MKAEPEDSIVGKLLHLNYQPRISWPFPILNRLRESRSESLQERFANWPKAMADASLALATKLAILRTVIGRFNRDLVNLNKDLAGHPDRVRQCMLDEFVYQLEDEDLVFQILASLDAFLYESRSAYELMGKFLRGLFDSVLKMPLSETTLRDELRDRGCDIRWIDVLHDERITYFHKTAPWIALRKLPAAEPTAFEMLIVRGHSSYHLKDGEYIELAKYRDIYAGFGDSLAKIQSFVLAAIERTEEQKP